MEISWAIGGQNCGYNEADIERICRGKRTATRFRIMSDNWDFYFCQVEGHPASIFVDLGISRELPLADLTFLAWLRLYSRQPREDGLSSKDEHERLCEIEDALRPALEATDSKIIFVGRNTSNCCRDFYFYAENGTQAESCLSMMMIPFAEYEFEVGSRPDLDWNIYCKFLYPSRRACQTIQNQHVLEALEKHGDHHDIEREVTHWLYFQSPEDRERCVQAAIDKGYKIVGQKDVANEDRPFGLVLSRFHAVDFGTINDVVLELFDLAEVCAGGYDGWETSVEKGVTPA